MAKTKKPKTDLVPLDQKQLQAAAVMIDEGRTNYNTGALLLGRGFSLARDTFGKDKKGLYRWAKDNWDYRKTSVDTFSAIHDQLKGLPAFVERCDHRALELFVRKSTPPAAIEKAKDRARKGVRITLAIAREIVDEYAPPTKRKRRKVFGVNALPVSGKSSDESEDSPPISEEDAPDEDIPDPTIEDIIADRNKQIESFCKALVKLAETCPSDEWVEHQGRRNVAIQKVKDACSALRGAKCHAKCPACEGGCDHCLHTGRVTKAVYDQMT